MQIPPNILGQGHVLFHEMICRNGIAGVSQDPISLERQQSPGFMTDRVDVLKEMQAGADNLSTEQGGLLLRRPGFEMKGKVLGDGQRGVIDLTTEQTDESGQVLTRTLDLQRFHRDTISHYSVHMNGERTSALVEHVDRHDPSKSWIQMQEWYHTDGSH